MRDGGGPARRGRAIALCAALAACASRGAYEPERSYSPRAVLVPPAPEDLGALGPAAAAALALERNPDLAMAGARVEAARAQLDAASSALWPRLAVDLAYLRGDAPSAFLFKSIDARALQPGTDFNHPGDFGNFEAGATLRWNLWDGDRRRLSVFDAEAGVAAVLAEREAAVNALVGSAIEAHLRARAASELIAADDASVRSLEAQVEETRVKVEGGGALRADLLSLEVRLAEARERRIRSGVGKRLALAALRNLLALPVETRFDVAAGEAATGGGLPPTAREGLEEAFRARAELETARRMVQRARIGVDAARRAYHPRVDLEARLYGDDEALSFDRNWTVALAASWDLFDAGRRAADRRRAQEVLREMREADRRAALLVALDVETAYLRLEEARARLDVAAAAVSAAEESLALVETQFRGGGVPVTRYLEAEAACAQARTNRIRAQLDLDSATVGVARALGRLGGATGGAGA